MDRQILTVEGRYRIRRDGEEADELVTWAVTVAHGGDGWTWSASAIVAGEEWQDDGGPCDSQAEAVADAEHHLTRDSGLTYGPGGDVLPQID